MSSNDISRYVYHFFTQIDNILSVVDWFSISILFGLFLLIVFALGVKDVVHKDAKLVKHFDDKIFFKSYMRNEFYNGVRRYALRKYDKHDFDFVDKEIELYRYFDSLIFDRDTDTQASFLTSDFCDYIRKYHPDYRRKDFSDAIIKYRRYYESQRKRQLDFEKEQFDNMCDSVSDAISDKKQKHFFDLSASLMSDTPSDTFETAYLEVVRALRDNNFIGLMPVAHSNDKYLMACLSDSCIIPHDKISLLCSDIAAATASGINVAGILICYDTFSDKYYIEDSEHMIERLAELMTFDGSDIYEYFDTFRSDVHMGHKILVKLLSLSSTGYTDINALRKELIRLYDSEYPHGYNSRVYDNI